MTFFIGSLSSIKGSECRVRRNMPGNTVEIDPLGNRTTYGYDKLGRWEETHDAFGGRVTAVYDAVRHLIASPASLWGIMS